MVLILKMLPNITITEVRQPIFNKKQKSHVSKYDWKGFNHFILWVFVVFSDDESKVAVNATWHSPHSHILQKLASE